MEEKCWICCWAKRDKDGNRQWHVPVSSRLRSTWSDKFRDCSFGDVAAAYWSRCIWLLRQTGWTSVRHKTQSGVEPRYHTTVSTTNNKTNTKVLIFDTAHCRVHHIQHLSCVWVLICIYWVNLRTKRHVTWRIRNIQKYKIHNKIRQQTADCSNADPNRELYMVRWGIFSTNTLSNRHHSSSSLSLYHLFSCSSVHPVSWTCGFRLFRSVINPLFPTPMFRRLQTSNWTFWCCWYSKSRFHASYIDRRRRTCDQLEVIQWKRAQCLAWQRSTATGCRRPWLKHSSESTTRRFLTTHLTVLDLWPSPQLAEHCNHKQTSIVWRFSRRLMTCF